jgi:microcystin degradation protein MlrC
MKLFLATIWAGCVESSSLPLSKSDFKVLSAGVPNDKADLQARWIPQFALREAALSRGWQVVESLCASSNPGRAINDDFYRALKEQIRDDLAKHGPFDAIALTTSGNTCTFAIADVEGDLLNMFQQDRARGATVAFFSNMHSDLTDENLRLTDLFMCLKHWPHTDWADRAGELFRLIEKTRDGSLKPVLSIAKPGMVALIMTTEEPYRGLLRRIQALESAGTVESISVVHSNTGVNSPDNEVKVVVTTNGDREAGQRVAKEIASEIFKHRNEITPSTVSSSELIAMVKASDRAPFIVGDYLDNPFSGSPADSTILLEQLLDAGITNFCCGPIFDPAIVQLAQDAGIGATLPLRIGGKLSQYSGKPLDLVCRIAAVQHDVVQHMPYNGVDAAFPTGTCVHVVSGQVDLILSSLRQQTFSPDLFTRFGIDLKRKKCVVVKSTKEFEVQFKAVSDDLVPVNSRIPRSGDFRVGHAAYDYSMLRRPLWPLDNV